MDRDPDIDEEMHCAKTSYHGGVIDFEWSSAILQKVSRSTWRVFFDVKDEEKYHCANLNIFSLRVEFYLPWERDWPPHPLVL